MNGSKRLITAAVLAAPCLVLFGFNRSTAYAEETGEAPPVWGVAEGFTVEVDTGGFVLPTAIAFVPEPGPEPSDPLYFVTELRGAIQVVTNDRTVTEYAVLPTFDPRAEFPHPSGEGGMAGVCLDPAGGHVFVTYTYRDGGGILRNGISRLDSTPGTFASEPRQTVNMDHILADQVSVLSHQIGPCEVEGDSVFVSIGDGANPAASPDTEVLLGKVMRMTLDGMPHPDNPLFDGGGDAAYVWAAGLRNPFGLDVVDGKVYVADNGPDVDRFLLVERGGDYLWDGTDWSIGASAKATFSPSVGPTQLEHYPTGSTIFPDAYSQDFFVGTSANGAIGIMVIPYDTTEDRSIGVGSFLVEARAPYEQIVTGVAFGPDALYFTSILPDESGSSDVYRLRYDPAANYPHGLHIGEAEELIADYGCLSCHQLGGVGGTVGPALDRNALLIRVTSRLSSPEYQNLVERLNESREDPFVSWQRQRDAVLNVEGSTRLALWMSYKLQEPRFDNPDAQMPDLGLTESEANTIASYLAGVGGVHPWYRRALERLFGTREVLIGFAVGAALGAAIVAFVVWFVRLRSRKARLAAE